jgi:hypothetical protein
MTGLKRGESLPVCNLGNMYIAEVVMCWFYERVRRNVRVIVVQNVLQVENKYFR